MSGYWWIHVLEIKRFSCKVRPNIWLLQKGWLVLIISNFGIEVLSEFMKANYLVPTYHQWVITVEKVTESKNHTYFFHYSDTTNGNLKVPTLITFILWLYSFFLKIKTPMLTTYFYIKGVKIVLSCILNSIICKYKTTTNIWKITSITKNFTF